MTPEVIIAICGGLIAICGTVAGGVWVLSRSIAEQGDRWTAALHAGLGELHERINSGDRDSQARHMSMTQQIARIDSRVAVVEREVERHISGEHQGRR